MGRRRFAFPHFMFDPTPSARRYGQLSLNLAVWDSAKYFLLALMWVRREGQCRIIEIVERIWIGQYSVQVEGETFEARDEATSELLA